MLARDTRTKSRSVASYKRVNLAAGEEAEMRVLFVASEVFPLAKSGGLADVSSALPMALARQGIDIRILMPGYPSALAKLKDPCVEARLGSLLGITDAALVSGRLPHSNLPIWLIDAPSLFDRQGGLYQDEEGRDWADNALRFGFLDHVAARIANGSLGQWLPDVVHGNDWHAGLIPLLLTLGRFPKPATVLTIHNLAFQGNFPREALYALGIPDRYLRADGIEFYGQMSFLKAGIRFSDSVTTVSPSYAREILTPEFGCGMDGFLRDRGESFSGILNGIDTDLWNPATDPHLVKPYDVRDLSGKRACKADLQSRFGLQADCDRPLIGFVSRLAHQKMADVVLESVPFIAASGAQFVLVGEGDPALETAFQHLGDRYRGSVAIRTTYDEALAHRLQAGADILLAPARFEPCGLTQMYALRYGTLPVVRNTGGLADTVTDATGAMLSCKMATGFVFDECTPSALVGAIEHALALYNQPLIWRRLQRRAMSQDFSWSESAARYIALYRQLIGTPGLPEPSPSRAIEASLAREAVT
jgi:starch synthase